MPLYYYRCCECKKAHRRLQTPEAASAVQFCDCGYTLRREPRPPSTQAVETLDNGIMTKRVERLADAERLFQERNDAVKKNQAGE